MCLHLFSRNCRQRPTTVVYSWFRHEDPAWRQGPSNHSRRCRVTGMTIVGAWATDVHLSLFTFAARLWKCWLSLGSSWEMKTWQALMPTINTDRSSGIRAGSQSVNTAWLVSTANCASPLSSLASFWPTFYSLCSRLGSSLCLQLRYTCTLYSINYLGRHKAFHGTVQEPLGWEVLCCSMMEGV